MSWEVDRSENKLCPCGKGHYTIVFRSNDWNQHEEQWSMHCSQCGRTHGLHRFSIRDRDGITSTYHSWVPAKHLDDADALRVAIEDHQNELSAYLAEKYGSRWLQHFEGMSKKKIWSLLTRNGSCYPSLSTFYNNVRGMGIERILKESLRGDSVGTVIRILCVDDPEIASRIGDISAQQAKLNTIHELIRQTGFE